MNTRRDRTVARIILALLLGYILGVSLATVTRANVAMDSLVNSYRSSQGLRSLTTSPRLTDLAQRRAHQIKDNFAHDFWWISQSGCTQGWAENIMYRRPAADNPVSYAFNAFMGSPTHYANIVGDYTHLGSAVWLAPDGGQYVAQLFGKGCGGTSPPPPPAPQPTQPPAPPPVVQPPAPAPVVVHKLPDTAMEAPRDR